MIMLTLLMLAAMFGKERFMWADTDRPLEESKKINLEDFGE